MIEGIKNKVTWSPLKEFNNYNISDIPQVPGIYRLSYKSPSDGKLYVFYIGKTNNLQQRLSSHLQDTEPNLCIRKMLANYQCAFRYAQLGIDLIDGAEAFLINHFRPSCNESIPQKPTTEINIDNQ